MHCLISFVENGRVPQQSFAAFMIFFNHSDYTTALFYLFKDSEDLDGELSCMKASLLSNRQKCLNISFRHCCIQSERTINSLVTPL